MRPFTSARRLVRTAALALVAALVLSMFFAAPATAATPLEKRMVRMINRERVERGEHRLRLRHWLTRNARRHSREMADAGEYYHNDRIARQLEDRRWNIVGENVGRSYDVPSMHNWFMQSPGHKSNILYDDFDRIGIGIVRRDGSLWFTQVFAG